MDVYAFVGPSGSGKSYRALYVAGLYSIDYIIDDGILISENKIIAGSSAKLEKTMMAAVKCAVFMDEAKRAEMIGAIKELDIKSILVLGTSEKMVRKIAQSLNLGEIKKIIKIDEVATKEEIELARNTRTTRGMHTVPLPTFAIKKEFSGLLISKLNILLKNKNKNETFEETKSVVRPTFSYFGEFHIRENVICDIAAYAAERVLDVVAVNKTTVSKTTTGVIINISVSLRLGVPIRGVANNIIRVIAHDVEHLTSINVDEVQVVVRDVV